MAMRHGQISRISAKALLAVVGFALLGACGDSVSPTATIKVKAKAPAGFDLVLGEVTFVWTPTDGATQRFGDHEIVIPAGAVCDPATSSYGIGHWDEPCTPATAPIAITATTFADAGGHPYVDFTPSIRFVPTSEVYLYLHDGIRDGRNTLAFAYCATTTYCFDEASVDSSLATQRVGRTRILYRRLKHFSGYTIIDSGDCLFGSVATLEDGTLFCNMDDGRGDSRSGYVVASGLGKTSGGNPFGKRRHYDK